MKKIAFIGRKQGLQKWLFSEQGLERGRLHEEAALKLSGLHVVDDCNQADLIQIRLNPEQTSASVLNSVRRLIKQLPSTSCVLNNPEYFSLYAEKHLAYRSWQAAGLTSISHQLWSFWLPVEEQIRKIRLFTEHSPAYFRTHNEDSGKGIFYLHGNESTSELRRIIYQLRWRCLTNRVTGSQALITREIQQDSPISKVFRVHMVNGRPIGGYALVGLGKIVHAADITKDYLDDFIQANQQLLQWMQNAEWLRFWQEAMQTLKLDFAALEFFCVNKQPVFLEANPMWGGKHKFGSNEFTHWLMSDEAYSLRNEIPNVFDWLDANRFYQTYWHALANI